MEGYLDISYYFLNVKVWSKNFVVLNNHLLSIFTKNRQKRRTIIELDSIRIEDSGDDSTSFVVSNDAMRIEFKAASEQSKNAWISAMFAYKEADEERGGAPPGEPGAGQVPAV